MSRVAPFRSIFTNFSKHFFLCDTSGESVRSQSESYNKISNKTNKFDFLTEQKSEERKESQSSSPAFLQLGQVHHNIWYFISTSAFLIRKRD